MKATRMQSTEVRNEKELRKALREGRASWSNFFMWKFMISFGDDGSSYIDVSWWWCNLRDDRSIDDIVSIMKWYAKAFSFLFPDSWEKQ